MRLLPKTAHRRVVIHPIMVRGNQLEIYQLITNSHIKLSEGKIGEGEFTRTYTPFISREVRLKNLYSTAGINKHVLGRTHGGRLLPSWQNLAIFQK